MHQNYTTMQINLREEDNLSTKDKIAGPNVSSIRRFYFLALWLAGMHNHTGFAKHMKTKHSNEENYLFITPAEYEEEECIGGMHHRYRLCKAYADQTF